MVAMGKNKDLQPWLDYFAMLRTYELKGFLEVKTDRREAFVTRAALLTLLGMDETALAENLAGLQMAESAADLLQRIRGYAGFRSQLGEEYLGENFALHIVKDEEPHDLLCTFLLAKKRNWLGRKQDHIEVVGYDSRETRNEE